MKIINIIFLFIAFAFKSYSQANENWKAYLKHSVYKADNKNYVYLFKSQGGKHLKNLYYSTKKGKNVLAIIYADTLVKFKELDSPNLFQLVKDNYENLKDLAQYIQRNDLIKNSILGFRDGTKITNQVGIRYSNLHFNHFPKFTDEQISIIKEKGIEEAMQTINRLYAILEELEK